MTTNKSNQKSREGERGTRRKRRMKQRSELFSIQEPERQFKAGQSRFLSALSSHFVLSSSLRLRIIATVSPSLS